MRFLQLAATAALLCSAGQATLTTSPQKASFADLKTRSYEDRIDILNRAPEAARNAFWVDKLESYLEGHLDSLDDEQTDALNQAIQLAKTRDRNKVDEVTKAMIAAFGREEAVEIVASVGGEKKGSLLESRAADCTCSVINDWCMGECQRSNTCAWTSWGCGTVQLNECDGTCYDNGHRPGDGRP